MRENILSVLGRGELIVSDGSMGAMLQAQGLPAGTLPEVWNEEHPKIVSEVHRAYLDVGAQMIITNTIGGNRLRLGDAGMAERAPKINHLAASLARVVGGDSAWVAGSVGPTGQLMEPYGALSVAEAEEVYAEQVVALAQGGVDVILIETQHDIGEAGAAVRMAKAKTDLPVFCTFAFNTRGRTIMGLAPDEAARRALEAGADVVGANCGDGPEAVQAGLEGMRGVTDMPLIAQANAGMPRLAEGPDRGAETLWDVTPAQMAEHARAYVSLGAGIVGGCCGTGPEHIAAIVAALRKVHKGGCTYECQVGY